MGTGCVVRDKLIVTCAHVVADALDVAKDTAQAPATPVTFDYPFVSDSRTQATVVLWWPYRQVIAGDRRHDLAILELEHPPVGLRPCRNLWHLGPPDPRGAGGDGSGVDVDQRLRHWRRAATGARTSVTEATTDVSAPLGNPGSPTGAQARSPAPGGVADGLGQR